MDLGGLKKGASPSLELKLLKKASVRRGLCAYGQTEGRESQGLD